MESTHPYLLEYNIKRNGFDESRKWDPSYYMTDFWNDIADPDMNRKPFMSGGPWGWIALVFFLIYWIRIQGPNSMKEKKGKDLRAVMLIFNGFTFGSYVTGLLVGLWYADWGLASFNCSALDPNDRSIDMYIRKSTGYVFLFGKVWDFIRPIFAMYRKRDAHITNMYLFHCFCSVFFVFLGLKLYPGGIFTFLPYMDGLYQIFAYGYLIKASSTFKPSYSYRVFLYRTRIFSGFLILLHGLYFLTVPNCGPTFLKLFQVVYAAVGLLIGPGEFRKMESLRFVS